MYCDYTQEIVIRGIEILKRVFVLFLLFAVLALFSQEYSNELAVYYFHRPPLYMHTEAPVPEGFICEIVDLVLKKSGLRYQWKEVPSVRVEQLFRERKYALAVGWYYKQEREEWAQYSHPIYTDGPMVAIVNSSRVTLKDEVTIETILSSPYKLGVLSSFSYGSVLDSAIETYKPQKNVISGTQEALLAMVTAGRIDYMFLSIEEAVYLRRKNQIAMGQTKIIRLKEAKTGPERYIIASKAVPAIVMETINKAISLVRNADEYKKIIDKYLKY